MHPRDLTAWLCAALAAALTLWYGLARAWGPASDGLAAEEIRAMAATLGAAWALILLPRWVAAARTATVEPLPWHHADAASTLAAGATLAGAGALAAHFDVALDLGIAGAGLALALLTARRQGSSRVATAAEPGGWGRVLGVAGFAAVTVWVAGFAWGSEYQSPFFVERIAAGKGHLDTLYHAAFAHMIQTYGVASTGLDGIPFVPYHFGSHWLFAHWSSLLGVGPLHFYQLGFAVLVVPLLLQAMLGFIIDLRGVSGHDIARWRLARDLPFWLLFAAVWTGVTLPGTARFTWVSANLVVSESYAVATMLLFLMGSMVLHGFVTHREDARPAIARPVPPLLVLVVIPLLVMALALTKVSTMAVAVGLLGFAMVRSGCYRNPMVSFGMIAALCLGALAARAGSDRSAAILPFAFVRQMVLAGDSVAGWLVQGASFIACHFLWTWAFLFVRIRHARHEGNTSLWASLKAGHLRDAEFVAVCLLGAATPGLVLDLAGGAAYYFSDCQRWVASSLLLGRFSSRDLLATLQRSGGPPMFAAGAGRPWPAAVVGLVLAALVLGNVATAALQWSRSCEILETKPKTANGVAKPLALADTDRQQFLTRLASLARLPLATRRTAAVHVPRDNLTYWQMLPAKAVPFVVPAVAGLAHIDGLPTTDFSQAYYGYGAYPLRTGGAVGSVEAAVARAKFLGFRTLYVMGGTQTTVHAVGRTELPDRARTADRP